MPRSASRNEALTAHRLRQLLAYDPDTGVFTWVRSTYRRGRPGEPAGMRGAQGYVAIYVDGRAYTASRLAFLYMTGSWPKGEVDHRDTNRSNNAWANLRDVPNAINKQNLRAAKSHNKSGLLGVSATRNGRPFARIRINGVVHHLGRFDTPELAHQAYVRAKRELHEGCTL